MLNRKEYHVLVDDKWLSSDRLQNVEFVLPMILFATAGFLYDITDNYKVTFFISGSIVMLAGLICLPLRAMTCCGTSAQHRQSHLAIEDKINDDLETANGTVKSQGNV